MKARRCTYTRPIDKAGDADNPHRYNVLFDANHHPAAVPAGTTHFPYLIPNQVSPSSMDVRLAEYRETQLRNPTIRDRRPSRTVVWRIDEVHQEFREVIEQDRRRAVIEQTVTGYRMLKRKAAVDRPGRAMSDLFHADTEPGVGVWQASPPPLRHWS